MTPDPSHAGLVFQPIAFSTQHPTISLRTDGSLNVFPWCEDRRRVGPYLQDLSLERVERFQILSPLEAGALYGTGSIYGVIIIQTRAGQDLVNE